MAAGDGEDRSPSDVEGRIRDVAGGFTGLTGVLMDTNPNLQDFAKNTGAASRVLSYLADQFKNFQGFANLGVSFDNNIQRMIMMTSRSALGLEDLSGMITESRSSFATLGTTLEGGVQRFLRMNEAFFDVENGGTDLSNRLERFGMTTEQINENLLLFDRIQGIGRMREAQTTAQRNAAAAEFTEELIVMARLTGQQADEMSANMAKFMREGDVDAFQEQLGRTQASHFGMMAESMRGISPMFQELFRDMVIRRRPGEDLTTLYSQLQRTAPLMDQYAIAIRDGTTTQQELDSLRNQIFIAYAEDMQGESLRRLAMEGDLTRETMELMRARGEFASGMGRAFAGMVDDFEREHGRMPGTEEINAMLERAAGEIRELGDPPEDGDTGRQMMETLLTIQRETRAAGLTLKNDIGGIYDFMAGSANDFAQFIRGAASGVIGLATDTVAQITDAIGALNPSNMAEFSQTIERAMNSLEAAGLQAESQLLEEKMAEITRLMEDGLTPEEETRRDELLREMRGIVAQSPVTTPAEIQAREVLITMGANGTVNLVNPRNTPPTEPANPDGTMFGSLSRFGRLFKDFGRETMQPLHGLEAVTTPSQMADIVMNAASGGRSALAQDLMTEISSISDSGITSATSQMGGMLNTMSRSILNSGFSSNDMNIDLSSLSAELARLPQTLRQPFEDALNNTIRQSIDMTAQKLALSEDHLRRLPKSIDGLSGDYMRG